MANENLCDSHEYLSFYPFMLYFSENAYNVYNISLCNFLHYKNIISVANDFFRLA